MYPKRDYQCEYFEIQAGLDFSNNFIILVDNLEWLEFHKNIDTSLQFYSVNTKNDSKISEIST